MTLCNPGKGRSPLPSGRPSSGFTLIELIVVITLIGLMLFLTLPRFEAMHLADDTGRASRWLMARVRALKYRSVQESTDYAMVLDIDQNRIWTGEKRSGKEDQSPDGESFYRLPEDLRLLDVEYAADRKVSSGQAEVDFYSKGYSDHAIVHIASGRSGDLSYLIEPFMPRVRMYHRYLSFAETVP